MTSEPASPLVSVGWLAGRLGDPRVRVLDIRSSESGGRAAFAAGHVPGAVHSDYAEDGWRVARGGAGGLLPDPGEVAALLGRLAITPEHRVVVVSAGRAPSDFSAAARVYWTLRVVGHEKVSVLDGGHAAWAEAGQPLEQGPPTPAPAAPYPVRLQESLRAQVGDVGQALARADATLLDGRSRAHFDGREKSPQAARAGRLPGAAHLDHALAFEPGTGRLRPKAELERLFGTVPRGPVVSYCNTGHLASTNWFVLSEVLGRPDVSLYDGSMSEWTQDPARPVVAGPAEG
jgi:thiosulfate/3-mercaptopyruvate sulfurtransferase